MLKLRPKMFDESAKSHASKNLWVQIGIFIVVFLVIYLAESIIPTIVAAKPMDEVIEARGLLKNRSQLSFRERYDIAAEVCTQPRVMIPTLISMGLGIIMSIAYVRFFEVRYVRSMGCRKKKAGLYYLTGLGIGALMMTAITMLTVVSGANTISVCSSPDLGLIALFLLGFLIQGMSEEFIFRGYFMTTIGGSHSPYIAVLVSSVFFGLAHSANQGISPLAMFNLILYGVFAALYMIHFDSIWGVCGVHSIWNFTQGNVYGISVSGNGNTESLFSTSAKSSNDILTGGKFGIEGSIFTTLVLLAGIVIVLVLQYKKEQAQPAAAE